jgi:branched-subunit amino acid aminotransferase/4-amino-4-deoxychorismate lyase
MAAISRFRASAFWIGTRLRRLASAHRGTYIKVVPVIRIGDRSLQPGPLYRQARALYWEFAHA